MIVILVKSNIQHIIIISTRAEQSKKPQTTSDEDNPIAHSRGSFGGWSLDTSLGPNSGNHNTPVPHLN